MRRAQDAAEAVQQRLEAALAALEPSRALIAALGGGGAGLLVHALEQRAPAVAADEQLQRLVEALPVEVRVEVVQARREAAAHLPVGARVLAAGQRAPAVAQPEQRVELLDQLGRRGAAADRPDADGVARGGLARDLEDRERDV